MPKGDPLPSPWVKEFADYQDRKIVITIPFDTTTGALLDGGNIHRDVGCLWTRIVWDTPDKPQAKRSPSVPTGDTSFTAAQVLSFSGFSTIAQLTAVQVTAEP